MTLRDGVLLLSQPDSIPQKEPLLNPNQLCPLLVIVLVASSLPHKQVAAMPERQPEINFRTKLYCF